MSAEKEGPKIEMPRVRQPASLEVWLGGFWGQGQGQGPTRPNSWAKQAREIEWGHLTLVSMTF